MDRITMSISGMSCGRCVGAVTRALESVETVKVEQVAIGDEDYVAVPVSA